MAIDRKQAYAEMKDLFGDVPSWVKTMPDAAVGGFWELMRDFQLGETRIPNKFKELIGIAVSGATRCRYCALFHTETARLFGATDEEIAEASMMGAMTMAGSTFLNAQQVDYDEFRKETLDAVQYARAHMQQQPARPSAEATAHA
jgi:AhpD family alkylhydroperoxidase